MNYITFGKGEKPLILIQGLSTRSIKGQHFQWLICIECLQEIIKFICLIAEKILAIA